VLKAFGYDTPKLESGALSLLYDEVRLHGELLFTLDLTSASDQDQTLMIDYIIHHQKKNGATSPKVFKWKKVTLPAKQFMSMTKKHPFKAITTRVYYAGAHEVEVLINGQSITKKRFHLSTNEE
jgi:hypothetical protein